MKHKVLLVRENKDTEVCILDNILGNLQALLNSDRAVEGRRLSGEYVVYWDGEADSKEREFSATIFGYTIRGNFIIAKLNAKDPKNPVVGLSDDDISTLKNFIKAPNLKTEAFNLN